MSRNKAVEDILAAWYELERAKPSERGQAERKLNALLVQAGKRVDPPATPDDILDHLHDEYQTYRRWMRGTTTTIPSKA